MNTLTYRALRYFWDAEPRNEDPSAMIWCLGQHYHAPSSSSVPAESVVVRPTNRFQHAAIQNDPADTWPPEFIDDFESRIWMTYRTEFPPIPRSPQSKQAPPFSSPAAALQYAGNLLKGKTASEGFSSDVGWGCMIRSAQSLLANALATLHLGRGILPPYALLFTIAWRRSQAETKMKHVEILSWFADDPNAPFSIHKFVQYGEIYCSKAPGEWFGP